MQRILAVILSLAWSLWFGGLVALFLFVQTLFAERRPIAGLAASALFVQFDRYHLILGVVVLLSGLLWWRSAPSRAKLGAVMLFCLASLAAIASAGLLTPRLEALRLEGQTQSPQFAQLHGLSMLTLSVETLLVLLGGLVVLVESTRPSTRSAIGNAGPPEEQANPGSAPHAV